MDIDIFLLGQAIVDQVANNLLLLIILVISLIAFIIFIKIIKNVVRTQTVAGKAFHKTILLIQVPKETKRDSAADENISQIKEQIATAGTFFASLSGLKPEKGIFAYFFGRSDQTSFEIVVKESKISFYIAMPDKYKNFIEQQIHAQYPYAEINEVPDYNIFYPDSHIVGAYLWFKEKSCFPFKTYKDLESDPLVAMLNPLSKFGEKESAIIQFVTQPTSNKWRSSGATMIREIRKGKKFEEVVKKKFHHQLLSGWAVAASSKPKEEKEVYQLTQMEEEMVKKIEDKLSYGGMEITIRVVSAANSKEKAKANLENIVNSFNQFNVYRYGNSFGAIVPRQPKNIIREAIYRVMKHNLKMVANTDELASFWHLPTSGTETPHVNWLGAKKAPPPTNMPREGVILGRTKYRGEETIVRLKREDRRRHLYTIGKSGGGKSVFIQNMAIQDIQNGEGVCIIDPHGDFVDYVMQHIPKERAEDVIYFNPADTERPIGLNMLEVKSDEQKDFAIQEMIAVFYKLVTDPNMIGPMFEHQMRNVMLTLMSDKENPGSLIEIPRMFTDDSFVEIWKKKITDPVVMAFWEKEMAKTSDFHKSEMLGYLISKVGRFVENEMVRNIVGQSRSGFNFREVMDQKKILLVNLSKGLVGEINSTLLGMIVVSKLQMAAMERAALPEDERHDFYLYIDEFQNFITESIATILSEARKYRLDLIIAHQYMSQLVDNKGSSGVRDAVLGNVGTMVSFRIGTDDAEILAKEFAPVFSAYDLLNVEQYTAYVKMLIDNTAAKPFNMLTFPPIKGNKELAAAIKELSRLKYGRPKEIVEREIMERAQLGVKI
jgi:hypothetical protein